MQTRLLNDQLNKQIISIIKTNFDDSSAISEETVRSIDWASFTAEIAERKLLPLIYFILKKKGFLDFVSGKISSQLKGLFLSLTSRNLTLLNELKVVVSELAKQDIEVMVFKGAALAEKYYPNIGLRPMADIDLLIKEKSDAKKLTKILFSMGYDSMDKDRNDAFIDSIIYETTFFKAQGRSIVFDIHHTLPYLGGKKDVNDKTNTEKVWQKAISSEIENQKIWLMSREDSICNIIGHELVQHKKDRILMYCDLGFLIKKAEIKWEGVMEAFKDTAVSSYAEHAFSRAKNEFGISIPEQVLQELNESSKSLGYFRKLLATESKMIHLNFFEELIQTKSKIKRLFLVARYLFPSLSYMEQAYSTTNKLHITFYYFYRPLNIAKKSCFLLWRLLREKIAVKIFKKQ